MAPVTRPPMALKIDCRTLTNSVTTSCGSREAERAASRGSRTARARGRARRASVAGCVSRLPCGRDAPGARVVAAWPCPYQAWRARGQRGGGGRAFTPARPAVGCPRWSWGTPRPAPRRASQDVRRRGGRGRTVLTSPRGVVPALGEAADRALDGRPGEGWPGRHPGLASQCGGAWPLPPHGTVHDPGPTSAAPGQAPGPWRRRASAAPSAGGGRLRRAVTTAQRVAGGSAGLSSQRLAAVGRDAPPGGSAVPPGPSVRRPAPAPGPG
jgi:hypothetical protein